MHAYDDRGRGAGVIYVLMLVIAVAFGGFVWQLYSAPDIPHIAADPGPYKIAPPPEASASLDQTETQAFDQAAPPAALTAAETEVAEVEEAPPAGGAPQLPAAPQFAVNGPYVAQLAALQSEAAVDQAWRRLSSRAPQLFAAARLDSQRADLGPRGIYYRVRAGYFADRANAARFCERIRQMGQDCIVTAR
jgi:hypothetical protein